MQQGQTRSVKSCRFLKIMRILQILQLKTISANLQQCSCSPTVPKMKSRLWLSRIHLRSLSKQRLSKLASRLKWMTKLSSMRAPNDMQTGRSLNSSISESAGVSFSLSIDIKMFDTDWFECAIKYVFIFNYEIKLKLKFFFYYFFY